MPRPGAVQAPAEEPVDELDAEPPLEVADPVDGVEPLLDAPFDPDVAEVEVEVELEAGTAEPDEDRLSFL